MKSDVYEVRVHADGSVTEVWKGRTLNVWAALSKSVPPRPATELAVSVGLSGGVGTVALALRRQATSEVVRAEGAGITTELMVGDWIDLMAASGGEGSRLSIARTDAEVLIVSLN